MENVQLSSFPTKSSKKGEGGYGGGGHGTVLQGVKNPSGSCSYEYYIMIEVLILSCSKINRLTKKNVKELNLIYIIDHYISMNYIMHFYSFNIYNFCFFSLSFGIEEIISLHNQGKS